MDAHLKRFFLFFILLIFLGGVSARAAHGDDKYDPELKAEVNKKEALVGDRIRLAVTGRKSKLYELIFPEVPLEPGDFSFVESRPVKAAPLRGARIGREYALTIFSTGKHVVPPVNVMYKKLPGEEWTTLKTPGVSIEVKSLLTGKETDIRDLKGLVGIPVSRLLVGCIALAALATLSLAGWMLWRRSAMDLESANLKPKSAHEIAYEKLKELEKRNLPKQGRVKEYYIRLSDIIRRYLEDRFFFRAPEMTTEEFMEYLKDSPMVESKHKKLLNIFLSQCDMVKFARYGPTPLEMLDSFHAAENLVNETKPEPPEAGPGEGEKDK